MRLGKVILRLLTALMMAGTIFVVASVATASMAYIPQPLDEAIRAAQIVAHVRITKITAIPCGADYTADILNTYKGKTESSLTFAARRSPITNRDREVRGGDELLVLLTPRSPAQEPYGNCCTEAKSQTPPAAELQCRAQLASYTPVLNFESAFLLESRANQSSASARPTVWLWYDRLRTAPPADIERNDIRAQISGTAKCNGPYCMVRWKRLEPRIESWAKQSAGREQGRK